MEQLKQNMKKKILVHESGRIAELKNIYPEILNRLNDINNSYKQTGFPPLTTDGLKMLYHNADDFIRKQAESLIGEIPSFGGLSMRKDAFIDTLQLPDTSVIKSKARMLSEFLKVNHLNALVLDVFEVEDGSIILNEDRFNKMLDQMRVYAVTDRQIETYEAITNFIDAYNRLDKVCKKYIQASLASWKGSNPNLPFIHTAQFLDINCKGELIPKLNFYEELAR